MHNFARVSKRKDEWQMVQFNVALSLRFLAAWHTYIKINTRTNFVVLDLTKPNHDINYYKHGSTL